MILWSIQRLEAYEKIKASGTLIFDYAQLNDTDGLADVFRPAYDFMSAQMVKRGIIKPEGVEYPLWAWYQWEGKRKKRDVRFKGLGPRGEKMVQLTLDIPDNEVLLADFDAWHHVLGGWFLPLSEEEKDAFESLGGEEYTAAMRKSWERVFDVFAEYEDDFCFYALNERSIQACIWQIKPEHVKAIQHYTAR